MNRYRISGKNVESHKAAKEITHLDRPGAWTLVREKTVDGIYVQKRLISMQRGRSLCFQVDGYSFKADRIEREKAGTAGGSAEDLKAQFPGKVRKILVQAGDKVEAGQGLLLVEAMKMEFQIKAPSKGTVKALLVKEGQQLSPGELMVDFTPEGTT